jgi:hypothetical protein
MILTGLAWLVGYLLAAIAGEFVFEITGAVNTEREATPAAVVWFVVLGLAVGGASAAAVSYKLLPPAPVPGLSLVVLPVLMSLFLWWFGKERKGNSSHLATWYGGAALGIGLAAGRFVGLVFVASVRAG